MKSIMEEASSILKAIEKCWTRAGKPQEFSVKILEKPEKYFFGLCKKPAKVALLYKDGEQGGYHKDRRTRQHKPYRRPYNRRSRSSESQEREHRDQQGNSEERRNKYQSRPQRDDSRRSEYRQRPQSRPRYSNKKDGPDSQ